MTNLLDQFHADLIRRPQRRPFAPFLAKATQRRARCRECAGDQHNLRAHLMILCWAAGNPTTFVRVTASVA